MTYPKLSGLLAAPFTAFDENGEVNYTIIQKQADTLVSDGVKGAYICGTTGEGISCTVEERLRIMEGWKKASGGRLILIAHTGTLSLKDVRTLNRGAVELGFDAVSVVPPTYFKPANEEALADYCAAAASSAPELPFYYYHTMNSGLNLSIYAVNGKLARLEDVPNIIFFIENVEKITNQQLGEQIYLLGQLSETIEKRSEDYTENVWRNSNIRVISNALRHDIDSNIVQVLPLLQELAHLHTAVCSETDVRVESTLEGTGRLVRILALAAESPTLPAAWILENDIEVLVKDVEAHKAQVGFIVSTEASLAAQYEPSIFAVEAEKCKEELCRLARILRERVSQKGDKTLVDELESIDKELSSVWAELDTLFETAGPLARKLKVEVPDSIGSLEFFIQSMRALEEARSLQPAPRWFNAGDLTHIKSEMGSHKALHGKVQQTEKQVLSKFDKEILDLDFYPVLQRFRSEYGSSFRIFNGKYRKDMKHLNSFLSSGGKLPHAEAFGLLTSLKGLKDGRVTIKDNLQQYKDSYGVYYEGPDTNWERVEEALGKFERIVGTLHTITSQPKDLYDQSSLLYSEIVQFNVQSASFSLEEGFGRLCSLLKHRFGKTSPYAEIKEHVMETCSFAERFLGLYRDLMSHRKVACDFAVLVSDLD